jgi:hypothetical protein
LRVRGGSRDRDARQLDTSFAEETHNPVVAGDKEKPMPKDEPTMVEDEVPDTLRMIPTTLQARAELNGALDALGAEEVCVLVRIAERLKAGGRAYGPLHIAQDNRAFRSKEAREELEDALVYLACAWLKAQTQEGH